MSIPPEIAFHRFFQRKELSPTDRQNYKGKQDLNALQPTVRSLLLSVQGALNEALRNEKKNVPEHARHPPFHFDYVDSPVPNALAFRYEGYSFIGITMRLVTTLWDTCIRLSRSERVATLLGVSPEEHDPIHALLLPTQLGFVVSHEYTHHVHGHRSLTGPDSTFPDEMLDGRYDGKLEAQAREIDADAYAVYHVLANLITGGGRLQAVRLLGREREKESVQDEALFCSFVIAVGAFFFVRPPITLDSAGIYKLTHPPQAARMNFVMHNAIVWCKQNRSALKSLMTRDRFQMLMSATAAATWGMNGGSDWSAQTAFLQSEDGSRYTRRLRKAFKAHVQSL